MLSARRDRLALVTQLLVPIALVLVALWARQATDAFPQEPALDISRYADALPLSSGCRGWGSCMDAAPPIISTTRVRPKAEICCLTCLAVHKPLAVRLPGLMLSAQLLQAPVRGTRMP